MSVNTVMGRSCQTSVCIVIPYTAAFCFGVIFAANIFNTLMLFCRARAAAQRRLCGRT